MANLFYEQLEASCDVALENRKMINAFTEGYDTALYEVASEIVRLTKIFTYEDYARGYNRGYNKALDDLMKYIRKRVTE